MFLCMFHEMFPSLYLHRVYIINSSLLKFVEKVKSTRLNIYEKKPFPLRVDYLEFSGEFETIFQKLLGI